MIYVCLLVAGLLKVILGHAARLLLLSRSRPEAWGATFGVAEEVSPLSCLTLGCLRSWAATCTILNLAQCLLFAGFSWMLQMWAREGLRICVCGTLHSFLSSSLLLHALVHAVGVTCGLRMTKNAGMWTRGCRMGRTCPSTCVVGVCPAWQPGGCVLASRWVQMTQESCGIWSWSSSEELKLSDLAGPQGTAFGS